jgi:hypothetical protein
MVFIHDSGSVFEASLEMVWQLAKDHVGKGNKIHPNTGNNKTEIISETIFVNSWEQEEANGQTIRMKVKGTFYYPLGIAFEVLEGPFADSKYFVYYFSDKSKTGVTVTGNFKSNTIPEDHIKPIVLSILEKAFNEDVIYLNTIKKNK